MPPPAPADWIKVTPAGLHVVPADIHVDPVRPVARAAITHGHGDHARPGNDAVLATRETLAIMKARFPDDPGRRPQAAAYGERIEVDGVGITFVPAGHVLGSAQILFEYQGSRVVVSGDYKRRRDPTCPAFEPVPCDVFITEATFGLPVFRHPDDGEEIAKLLAAREREPDRAVLVGAYALGKCQRVIALLREAGHDAPIYLHGAQETLCALYEEFGVRLGPLKSATGATKAELAGAIVLAPPGATADRWMRRLPDPVTAVASGWMRIRQRAKQRGVELPLVISDHADWDELLQTVEDVNAPEVWVTHGREEALIHAVGLTGRRARALALVGFDEEGQ